MFWINDLTKRHWVTEFCGSFGEISATHVSLAKAIRLQSMVPLTGGDSFELQGHFRVADAYFAADQTSLCGGEDRIISLGEHARLLFGLEYVGAVPSKASTVLICQCDGLLPAKLRARRLAKDRREERLANEVEAH